MNVLITGATGFIGGFIVDQALAEGLNVFATVRKSSNKQYLTDNRIQFLEFDFSDRQTLTESLKKFNDDHGNVDYVIHNAGVTKALKNEVYESINYNLTVDFVEALKEAGHKLKKFTFISSMAASAPGSNETKQPIKITDPDEPVSAYGASKKKAELYLENESHIPYVILRPPPVFGPRDADMFTVFELIHKKLEMYIGGQKQLLSFIYVKDLARGIVKATISEKQNKKYFLSDNKAYDNFHFNSLIKSYLNTKTITLKLPIFAVYLVAFFSELYSKLTGNLSQLNLEKIKELRCTNWVCDSNEFYQDIGIEPMYSLEAGVRETIDWYKENNWLK